MKRLELYLRTNCHRQRNSATDIKRQSLFVANNFQLQSAQKFNDALYHLRQTNRA